MPLGLLVREAREARGWSQGELGERLGVSGAQVSRIESGVRGTSVDVLARLAQELALPADQVLAALAEGPDAL